MASHFQDAVVLFVRFCVQGMNGYSYLCHSIQGADFAYHRQGDSLTQAWGQGSLAHLMSGTSLMPETLQAYRSLAVVHRGIHAKDGCLEQGIRRVHHGMV